MLDDVLGLPDATAGGITVLASQHLPGDVMARGSSAFDGDPTTAWNTAFGQPQGQWVEVHTAQPVTFDHLDLQVVADGRHSVPTQLRIDAGGESRTVDVPAIADQSSQNAVQSVPVTFAPLTGDDVRVTVTAIRPVTTTDFHEGQPIVMPVALAEVGIPGVQRAALPSRLSDACRTDLLTVDGAPVGIRLDGDAASAAAGGAVDFELCDGPVTLAAGDHVVRSARGVSTGIDVDRLVLGSQAGGSAMTLDAGGAFGTEVAATRTSAGGTTPTVKVVKNGRTKMEVRVEGAQPGQPFWLVLGESNSAGWRATVDGNQGSPTLVDGYANGWLVTPATRSFSVTLEWTPQRTVWIALAISAAALLLCLVLVIVWRKRRTGVDEPALDGPVEFANPFGVTGSRCVGAHCRHHRGRRRPHGRGARAVVGRVGRRRTHGRGVAPTALARALGARRAGRVRARGAVCDRAAIPTPIRFGLLLAHALRPRAGDRVAGGDPVRV